METDDLYKKISDMEDFIKDTNKESDKFDADIRDSSKKVQKLETAMEETLEKLQTSASKMEEAEKEFKDKDDDVNAAARRCVLMEEEVRINTEKLATTVHKLANMSKDADKIVKGMREWENKTMNNEVEIEELDKNMRNARSIGESFSSNEWDVSGDQPVMDILSNLLPEGPNLSNRQIQIQDTSFLQNVFMATFLTSLGVEIVSDIAGKSLFRTLSCLLAPL